MTSVPIRFHKKWEKIKIPKIPDNLVKRIKVVNAKINSGVPNFEKLEAVYALSDQFNSEYVAKFAVCQKGCNHCCKIDVSVSLLEAEYITFKGGPQYDMSPGKTENNRTDCPFLAKEGTCTIYDTRPFFCRTFHTLDDPEYCAERDEKHQVYGSASTGYGNFFYAGAAGWLKRIHDEKNSPYRDIRDWFPSSKPSDPPPKKSLWNSVVQRFQRQPV